MGFLAKLPKMRSVALLMGGDSTMALDLKWICATCSTKMNVHG
jgi:hypothetical protein